MYDRRAKHVTPGVGTCPLNVAGYHPTRHTQVFFSVWLYFRSYIRTCFWHNIFYTEQLKKFKKVSIIVLCMCMQARRGVPWVQRRVSASESEQAGAQGRDDQVVAGLAADALPRYQLGLGHAPRQPVGRAVEGNPAERDAGLGVSQFGRIERATTNRYVLLPLSFLSFLLARIEWCQPHPRTRI